MLAASDRTTNGNGPDRRSTRIRFAGRLPIDVAWCPHRAGPPRCWCRKPLPGLALAYVATHRLDLARCRFVGSGGGDRAFATRLGSDYVQADDFFG